MADQEIENNEKVRCSSCKELKDVTDLFYCLCDTPVCSKCVESLKINENEWKCPNCNTVSNIKSSQLFRQHYA